MSENFKKKQTMFKGDVFQTKHGELTVIEYITTKNVRVKFTDTGYEATTCAKSIREGYVKDYLKPSVAGVGYLGATNITKDNPETRKIYTIWQDMLNRCYLDGYGKSSNRYFGRKITVCDEWKNFSTFLDWSIPIYTEGYHLDKDILGKGMGVYSPDTCYYIPRYINLMFSGRNTKRGPYPIGVTKDQRNRYYRIIWTKRGKQIYKGGFTTPEEAFAFYKKEKEAHIKEVAQEYYDRCEIPKSIYEKLMGWEIVPYPE